MKRKLLFLAALAVSALGFNANAQSFSGEDGKYYLQNVESGLYWGAGNDWGTQASLVKNPEYVTLISNGDGTYKMESQVTNGGENYYFNGNFMDNTPAVPLTITASGDNYTIAYDAIYYGWDGKSTVLGKELASDAPEALWKITSEADMKASLANATAENPVDATFLILDPNFGRNNRNQGAWSMVASNQNLSGGNDVNNCAESYHAVFTLSQKIENAPKGIYKLTAQGFYRQDGSDNANLPYIYLNDTKGGTFNLKTGSENEMADASASFTNGLYAINPAFIELTADGDLTVGAKLETNTNLWCIWDNFELTYYGADADLKEVMLGDLIKQVAALREQATALKANDKVREATASKLDAALSDTETIDETVDAYNTAIATLTAAINEANKEVENKTAIDAMYEVLESTNVYTTDAYNTYKALADDYLSKYEAGTLEETVVNPTSNLGWQAGNNIDDYLLSAWTIGGEQAKDYDKALHINVWSTEGNDDGTNFKTPFFEYWVGDADVLKANTIAATVNDVEPGEYIVSAWVRVRTTNGKDPKEISGITLSVNDGDAVDVTKGTQTIPTGNGYFNLAEYKAIGTVGEDGKLVITFDVETENISWLSFKNVVYAKIPSLANPSFELSAEGTPLTEKYEISGENPEIYGWTADGFYSASKFSDAALLKDGEKMAASNSCPFGPSAPSEGDYSFYTRFGWNAGGNTMTLSADAFDMLPAGEYLLAVDYKQYSSYDDSSNNAITNVSLALQNGSDVIASATSGAAPYVKWSNISSTYFTDTEWSTLIVPFTLDAPAKAGSQVVITLNARGSRRSDFFLDNVQLLYGFEAIKAKVGMQLEALKPVGKGLFYYDADEVAAAKAALEAAETEEDVLAIEMPTLALPVEGIPYVIANTEADGNLNVGENITVETDAIVYFTPVNGGYAISNSEGEYIFKTNTGSWDNYGLAKTAELAQAYVISVTPVEGGYTLNGANGSLGTDETETGSKVWANKGSNDGHYIWTITEYTPTVTVTDAGYATYVTPFDVKFSEVEAYIVSGLNEDNTVATLEPITEAPAGTPVVIKADEGTHELKVVAEAAEVEIENLLKVATGEETGEGIYVLANLNEVVGFYALEEGVTVPAGKAYLKVDAANGIKFIGFEGNGGATGIQGVENNAAAETENGAIYNLAGQRVQNPTKGIYIVNGKKVLVK